MLMAMKENPDAPVPERDAGLPCFRRFGDRLLTHKEMSIRLMMNHRPQEKTEAKHREKNLEVRDTPCGGLTPHRKFPEVPYRCDDSPYCKVVNFGRA